MTHEAILDPASDTTGAELMRLASLYEFPDFVKNAAVDDLLGEQDIVSNAYADAGQRKFACHTPASTWLSSLYFQEHKATLPEDRRAYVADRLQKFAEYFGITTELASLQEKSAALHAPEEIPDSDFAYIWDNPEQGVQRFYPLRTAQEIKQAADWLESVRDQMIYEDRQKVASRILEKAGTVGVGLSDEQLHFLDMQAGNGLPDVDALDTAIRQRASFAKKASQRAEITKMAELIRQTPQLLLSTVDTTKLASVIEDIDDMLGLRSHYSEQLKRPEEVLFGLTHRKVAADVAALCTLSTDATYANGQFEKLSRDMIEADFGTDVANQVCTGFAVDGAKFASFAKTLPRASARQLEQLMSEVGEHSQFAKAGGALAIPDNELEKLAVQLTRRLPENRFADNR